MDLDLTYQAGAETWPPAFAGGLLTESVLIAAAQKINPEPEMTRPRVVLALLLLMHPPRGLPGLSAAEPGLP